MRLLRPQDKETICALATPAGTGALALIRISGSKTLLVAKKLFPFLPDKPNSFHLYYGTAVNPKDGEEVDEVLVSYFKKGKSFTNEESVEITCHGGGFIASQFLEILVNCGVRIAERGEFSYRAFMNGRIDLMRAESILDLIHSRSPQAKRQALAMLKGKGSRLIRDLEGKLLQLLAHVEAEIDFIEEDITPFSLKEKKQKLSFIIEEVTRILDGYQQGQFNKKGIQIVLLGAVNAGKSSLFNHLVGKKQAIVTSYPGTTRDVVMTSLLLRQREFIFKDTAGFRLNPGNVEREGIKKTLQELEESHLVVYLIDGSKRITEETLLGIKCLSKCKGYQKWKLILSKSDQVSTKKNRLAFSKNLKKILSKELEDCKGKSFSVEDFIDQAVWVSSFSGEGMESLKEWIGEQGEGDASEVFLSNARQFTALTKIRKILFKAFGLTKEQASQEFIAFELRRALEEMEILLGKRITSVEVIDQVFKEFCIGK